MTSTRGPLWIDITDTMRSPELDPMEMDAPDAVQCDPAAPFTDSE